MSNSYKAYIADISDFRPDEENANRHTLRGRSLVHKGMEKRGYARPAFAAKDGTVLGGNLSTLDVAVDIGLGDYFLEALIRVMACWSSAKVLPFLNLAKHFREQKRVAFFFSSNRLWQQ